jgi:hypothetical protein
MQLAEDERILTSPKRRYHAADVPKSPPRPEFVPERRKVAEIAK